MSVVDDILTMDSAESRCSINGDTRDIVVPDEYHIFGVESDENVTRIPFICPKIVGDNVDLTGYSLYINYINGAGLGGIYVVDDVVTNGDNITFSWLLSRNVTAKAGTVSYIICAKKSGTDTKVTNEWNTKIATGTVSSGIETYDTVAQQSSDVINKLLKLTQGQSAYDIAIDNGFVGTKAAWLESLKGTDGKSAYQYAMEGGYTGTEAEFVEKMAQEQLAGRANEITPTQVYEAVSTGIPVKIQYPSDKYGLLSFTTFNIAESLNMIVSQTITYANGVYILAELFGDKSNNGWGFHDTTLAEKTDIPSSLPNPNALTFTGAVTGSYDGSAPMSVEIPSGGGSGSDISLGLTGATVGQIAKITAVDASGKPTEWEAADIPSGVQPDWNQNDDTQPDYVKNRPFYTGAPVETVLVEESTVSFADNGGLYRANFPSAFEATVGETYKVSWDGIVYECTSVSVDGLPAIGNLAIFNGGGSDTGEPFIMGIQNGERITIFTTDTSASHTFSISGLAREIVKIDAKYLPFPFKPDGISYLTFSSPSSFILGASAKGWDGTFEYFASDETWTIWDGISVLSAVANGGEYVLYLRGTGNTVITHGSGFVFLGSNISCIGNIETLLDYATVESGGHPVMAEGCYQGMFQDCTSLTRAPELPATTLANSCYNFMFSGCTNLIQAPELPATTLASYCYQGMFQDCTSLTQAPELPATTLASSCYYMMFQGCTSLTQVSELPATTLASGCYYMMFSDCTSLTQAPELPATILASECYYSMFDGCTSLAQISELPATTLANLCYYRMFYGCTSLKLSETKNEEYTQEYRIPLSGDGTDASAALAEMFISTGGTFTGTPSINTTYYLSSDNMIVRETEVATLNGYVRSMIDNAGECIPVPATAKVGQTVVVKAIDENGKPTAWEAVDIPSGVQSDWNQNDGTQHDYVKNRPFYTGGPVETTFVEDSTVSFTRNEYSGFYLGSLQSTFKATVGETYKVSWDGTAYECTCADSNGKTIIGNLSMMGAGSDTGEPFIMMVQNRVGIEIATADTSASHTFSIGGFIPEIVKIDRKYLPKAAFITYDSSNSTYISDLANDELYETLLNGQQVVCLRSDKCKYLTEWTKKPDGRIELIFSGGLELSLYPDGTIGKPSPE